MGATMGSFLSVKRFFSVLKGSVLKPEKNLVVVFQKKILSSFQVQKNDPIVAPITIVMASWQQFDLDLHVLRFWPQRHNSSCAACYFTRGLTNFCMLPFRRHFFQNLLF